uniref:Uncharacterized protein n=1 Tax=Poecilia reticulata TaxID=8081 RepID=A0A3P9NFK4_POERE
QTSSFGKETVFRKTFCLILSSDRDFFLNLLTRAQSGRLDDQRASLSSLPVSQSENDDEKLFSLVANSQGRRLDDQRMFLPSLPGIQNGGTTSKATPASPPYIIVNEGTPATSRKSFRRSSSQPQIFDADSSSTLALPKSASFTPETEFRTDQNSQAQVETKLEIQLNFNFSRNVE